MAYGPAAPTPGAERSPMPSASGGEVRLARSSRTSIGYAVVPPVALRTSGLRDPEAAYDRTTFDPALPDVVERHDRATRALRVTKK